MRQNDQWGLEQTNVLKLQLLYLNNSLMSWGGIELSLLGLANYVETAK